jgi:hypothetical protein
VDSRRLLRIWWLKKTTPALDKQELYKHQELEELEKEWMNSGMAVPLEEWDTKEDASFSSSPSAAAAAAVVESPAPSSTDYKRNIAFLLYGSLYQGMSQEYIYNHLYPLWFGTGTDIHTVLSKVAFDLLVQTTLLTLPMAYLIKGALFASTPQASLQNYVRDVKAEALWQKYFALWGPVQCCTFSIVPEHYRVTFIALVSFFWLIILSNITNSNNSSTSSTNTPSNTPTDIKPVKISVVRYRQAKDAVGQAIQSVEKLTEKIQRDQQDDLSSEHFDEQEREDPLQEEEEKSQTSSQGDDKSHTSSEGSDSEEIKDKDQREDAAFENNTKKTAVNSAPSTSVTKPTTTAKSGGLFGFLNSGYTTSRPIIMSTGNKTRVAERLTEASNKSTVVTRSGELDTLKEKFDAFIKQFKPFIATLKNYHAAVVALEYNRSEVRHDCYVLLVLTLVEL